MYCHHIVVIGGCLVFEFFHRLFPSFPRAAPQGTRALNLPNIPHFKYQNISGISLKFLVNCNSKIAIWGFR